MIRLSEQELAADARRELLENILPFWRQQTVDDRFGGFIAELSNNGRPQPDAPKGLILNTRILWTFSAAFQQTRDPVDQALAHRALDYLFRQYLDARHGGYFWELDPRGRVVDDKKKIYGQAFAIYALAEYYQAFSEPRALEQAIAVYRLIEEKSRDSQYGGYAETLACDWQPCADVRLSDKDMNEKKSMNNHLHVLEAYTRLLRVWPDPRLADRLEELIRIFQRHILTADGQHFHHFFDESWTPKSNSHTFGHDIEGSWLLCEAAENLQSFGSRTTQQLGVADPNSGDCRGQSSPASILAEVRFLAVKLARAVLDHGLDADGGLFYECRNGQIVNADKEWWPQAEAVVGFINAWQLSHDPAFLAAATRCWQFIQARLVDRVRGEWFWRVDRHGKPDLSAPKVSAWKCPYHNGRCCLELWRRLSADPV